jgi:hypothetical protein
MSFKTAYQALFNQLKDYSVLRKYMDEEDFYDEFKQAFPQKNYIIFLEPGTELPENLRGTTGIATAHYNIEVVARLNLGDVVSRILGNNDFKGILDFTEDVKAAIRSDLTLGLYSQGTSVSVANSSGTYNLTGSARYLTVQINGNDPSGYDTVDCGTATASGATIAAQIQTSLRALVDTSSKTGFADVVVSFDAVLNKFTITSQEYGAISLVQVTAGASDDASVILGFDNPVEKRGQKIITIDFGEIQPVDDVYPITYRTIPLVVQEEVYVY